MAKTLKSRNASLRQEAEKNASITRKVAGGEPTVIKKGIPLDHSSKHTPYAGAQFGLSKGVTKNMDNYESLRVDVWLTDTVQEGETPEEAFIRVESIVDRVLEEAVLSTIEG